MSLRRICGRTQTILLQKEKGVVSSHSLFNFCDFAAVFSPLARNSYSLDRGERSDLTLEFMYTSSPSFPTGVRYTRLLSLLRWPSKSKTKKGNSWSMESGHAATHPPLRSCAFTQRTSSIIVPGNQHDSAQFLYSSAVGVRSASVASPSAMIGACGTPFGSTGTPQRSVASGPGTARIFFCHTSEVKYVPTT